jgi:hypothetical protein
MLSSDPVERRLRAGPCRNAVQGYSQRGGAGGHGRPSIVDEGFGQNRHAPVGVWRPVSSPMATRAGLAAARVARSRSAAAAKARAAGTVNGLVMGLIVPLRLPWGAMPPRN